MASNCNAFYKVNAGDSCYVLSHDKGISLGDFYAWNPAVRTDCSGLQANVYVCVGTGDAGMLVTRTASITTSSDESVATPTPTQHGMTDDCNKFYEIQKGDGCWDIAADLGISEEDIIKWNPAARPDCSGLLPDYYICVGTHSGTKKEPAGDDASKPSHTSKSKPESCNTFYKVKKGDGCYDIVRDYQISLADFYTWNANVNAACTNLQADTYVCVGL